MNPQVPVLTTSRLLLRPLEIADADAVQRLFPQWEIVRFMTNRIPWPYPSDGALAYIRDVALPATEVGTQWHWSIRLSAKPDQLIGAVSLMDGPDANRAFWLDPAMQGKGLMQEASDAVTDYWFNVLGRAVLRAPKAVANVKSRRISERRGMRVIGTQYHEYVSGRQLEEIWEITRDEWLNRRR